MFLMSYVPYIIIGAVLLVLIIIVSWLIATRNKFVKMEQDVENSLSRIDVYLTKRYDVLTKMVAATKSYTKHEKETLAQVIQMRNPGAKASLEEKAEFDAQMNSVARQLTFVAEQYPNLKADTVFDNLQKSISEIEENLQAARSNYNANVATYNKAILVFPASIVAGNRFTKKEYFEAEQTKQEDVKIEL